MGSKENSFNGRFDMDSQVKSIPIELLTLKSTLIDGLSMSTNIGQASLTISQLIVSNFKQKGNNKDHNCSASGKT